MVSFGLTLTWTKISRVVPQGSTYCSAAAEPLTLGECFFLPLRKECGKLEALTGLLSIIRPDQPFNAATEGDYDVLYLRGGLWKTSFVTRRIQTDNLSTLLQPLNAENLGKPVRKNRLLLNSTLGAR